MEYKFQTIGKTGVISMSGRLDQSVSPGMKAWIQRYVDEGYTRLVFDMTSVSFIDSSGLGSLIGGLKAARLAGGWLRIACPSEQVRYILHVSTLERVLKPYDTMDEALAD